MRWLCVTLRGTSDDDVLTLEANRSLAHALDDMYGIPWSLSALELEKLPQMEVSVDSTVTDPSQVFTLTLQDRMPDNVHRLPEVAKEHLCRVELIFVEDKELTVYWIPVLSAPC